ncbi:MAG: WD40/YVTN/BNR-like repeat-containing protein, partial [Candidatus Zixiibacteriota bacterium]
MKKTMLRMVAFASLLVTSCGDDESPTEPQPPAPGDIWTLQSTITTTYLFDVAWSGTRYVAVGESGTILTSLDGFHWTSLPSPTNNDLFGVTWSGEQFVAVGNIGTIATSQDGTKWSLVDSNVTSNWLHSVASSGTAFVAVGQNG